MIDYETYCKIRDHRDRQGLSITQTAHALGLHPETVSKWSRRERYEQRAQVVRGSQGVGGAQHSAFLGKQVNGTPVRLAVLAHVGDVVEPRLCGRVDGREVGEIRAIEEVFLHVANAGLNAALFVASGNLARRDFEGVMTRIIDVTRIEHRRRAGQTPKDRRLEVVHHDLSRHVGVGSTRRRLSFFVMVQCYSRQMYVEFTVSQSMEHFLGCHERAFAVLGLSSKAPAYYEGLLARRFNARGHVRKIIALAEIYGTDACSRAIDDALVFNAFSSEYIAHLLEARARTKSQPWLRSASCSARLTRSSCVSMTWHPRAQGRLVAQRLGHADGSANTQDALPARYAPLHVLRAAEIILVLRFTEPAALTRRLAGRPTGSLRTVLLTSAIAHIHCENIAAAQALAL